MAVAHLPPAVDLGGRALLLGPGGEVDLVTETPTPSAASVDAQVGDSVGRTRPVGVVVTDPGVVPSAVAAGATLLVLDAPLAGDPAVVAAANADVAVMVGGRPDDARDAANDLMAQGAAPGRVLVEVAVPTGAPVDLGALSGLDAPRLAAVVGPGAGPGGPGGPGWEIGVLTRLLSAGVRVVRGVDPVRFRRVRAVVEAIDEATPDRPGEASPGQDQTGDHGS